MRGSVVAGHRYRRELSLTVVLIVVAVAAPAASARSLACTQISGIITTELELAGEVCVTGDVLLRQGGAITLAPGTEVSMCAGCSIQVSGGGTEGRLTAEGTPAQPIVFAPATPGAPWERLLVVHPVSEQTILRHVVLNGGGGSDPTASIGALHIDDGYFGSPTAVPVVDHVTIDGSGAYGLAVDLADDDQTPPSITNVTITGSARAPIRVLAAATGGLGRGLQLTGNAVDTIHVGTFHAAGSGLALSRADMTWRNHGVPWELTGNVVMRDMGQTDVPTTLRIEAGNTILLHPGVDIQIGTLGTAFTRLLVEGTAAEPVLFDRVDAGGDPWGRIHFGQEGGAAVDSVIRHALLLHGGRIASATAADATIVHRGHGTLELDHVQVLHSANAAVYAENGVVTSSRSRFESNHVGFRVRDLVVLRGSVLAGNPGGAVVNLAPTSVCVDAVGNYWGDPSGPADPSAAADGCSGGQTNAGIGDVVSDGVRYRPLLAADTAELPDASSISPEPFWVVADGVDTALVTITLLAPDGQPVVGKQIELSSDLGTVGQPLHPTDVNGQVTATLTSSEEGYSILTARNVTDGVDLASLGGVVFWGGDPVWGGLIAPGGVPYAAPQLVVDGAPFRTGFPMTFRMPMQNGTPDTLNVEILWEVREFGIGGGWGEVATLSESLPPGAGWDAATEFFPPSDGHRCVRATFTITPSTARQATNGTRQKNTDTTDPPCRDLDPGNLIPDKPGGLGAVVKHQKKATQEAYKVNKCLSQGLGGGSPRRAAGDHQQVVVPAVYTPPLLAPGVDVDQPEADASNAVAGAAARLIALDEALRETSLRMRGAAQARDDAASRRQLDAYQGFQRASADELDLLAAGLAELLAVTEGEGEPDTLFLPAELDAYIEELQTTGYDAETIAFHEAFGRTLEEIEAMRQREIAKLQGLPGTAVSFYGFLDELRAAAVEGAASLRATYGSSTARTTGPPRLGLEPMEASFVVTNPDAVARTVELRVRPVELPVGWTWSLDGPSPLLEPGGSTTMKLRLDPAGGSLVEGARVRMAVEGYVLGDLVGGILIETAYPALPLLVFEDGFDDGTPAAWSGVQGAP